MAGSHVDVGFLPFLGVTAILATAVFVLLAVGYIFNVKFEVFEGTN